MTASTGGSGPRLLPVPRRDPPYDDERVLGAVARPQDGAGRAPRPGVVPLGVQGTLALAFVLPSGLTAEPVTAPRLRLVGSLPGGLSAQLPPVSAWAARVAQAVVEVLSGDRPVAQLARWTSPEVHDQLRRGAVRAARSGAAARTAAARASVRCVRVCSPAEGVVEASAVVIRHERVTAMALRLEDDGGRWRCTALQVG